jgi:alkylated DNA repair dioxygenase AlkB
MRPTFIPDYTDENFYDVLLNETPWLRLGETPRRECFMAVNPAAKYRYGTEKSPRVYDAAPMHPAVRLLMDRLNEDFGTHYNVCVLNAYADGRDHLGWHGDRSPEQDPSHPIAVIAFGAAREIWIRDRGVPGDVLPENKFLMTPGGVFIMPEGFQDEKDHRIPKTDRPCEGRVSLTFRKLDRNPDGSILV